jgi:hypothetical protein
MLNCFAPNINIVRDPRWGRGHETYGEVRHAEPGACSVLQAATWYNDSGREFYPASLHAQ